MSFFYGYATRPPRRNFSVGGVTIFLFEFFCFYAMLSALLVRHSPLGGHRRMRYARRI